MMSVQADTHVSNISNSLFSQSVMAGYYPLMGSGRVIRQCIYESRSGDLIVKVLGHVMHDIM